VLLLDLESTNGTFANGAQVLPDQPLRLADGAMIRFGRVVARYTTHSPDDPLCVEPNQALLMQSEHPADSPQGPPLTAGWMSTAQGLSTHWSSRGESQELVFYEIISHQAKMEDAVIKRKK
jgi:pSer/pThr/pTyr-binding forkhead associated (FHA) protein